MMSPIDDELRKRAQPIADLLEKLPISDAMAMLSFIVGSVMSRSDLQHAPMDEMISLHGDCIVPHVIYLRAARSIGEYPFPQETKQ